MSSSSRAAGESASRPCSLKLVEVIEHSMRADATLCVALLMALLAGALMLTMRGSLIGRHLVAVYWQSTDAGRQRCEAPVLVGLMPNSTVSWSVKASTGLTLNASSWTTHEAQTALDLRHCSLRRFTQAEAQQCLAGRPIVAIGDSLTRYQYLSLVNFLDTGLWRDTASTTRSRNLTYLHAGHHDYGPYYAALSGPQYFGDRMSCDCYRTRTKFIAENHFYKGSCGVSASFYYYSGYPKPPMIEQLQGHFGFPPFSNKTQCTPGECNAPADWSMSLEEALQRVIPLLKPAILLINFGLWRRATETPWSAERFDAIMREANNAVKPRNGQVIWKTTTATKSGNVDRHWDDDAVAAANRHGASVLDTWALTKPLPYLTPSPFVDNGHYTPPIYAELNNVLLNLLC